MEKGQTNLNIPIIIVVVIIVIAVALISLKLINPALIPINLPFLTSSPITNLIGPTPTPNPFAGARPTTNAKVTITKDGMIPATITVIKGSQITFINTDIKPHQIASDPHPTHDGLPGFDSEEALKKDESFSFIFENSGKFSYHDHLNPNNSKFTGTVIVQ